MKHALLCRILVYIIILGMFIAPITVVVSIESIPAALKGIEKVAVTYHTDFLTKEQHHSIFHSANARALRGKKQHRLLDKEQKAAPPERSSSQFSLGSSFLQGVIA
ncbi:MAG: hypothetical protein IKM59_02490 [Oscillospiraceae bacterium]|nr:hypothetical protein [Oscillospiraceae bacterium]